MPGRDLPDLDQRLRSLPAALAVDAPAGLAERIAHQGRRRRWLRRATAAAAVLVLLGGVAVTRSVLVGQPKPVLNPGLLVQDATPEQLAGGRWRTLPPMTARPPGQAARRSGQAVVWTGQELLVWGGLSRDPFRTRADGAAYDPRTGRWAPLPDAPEGQWLQGDHQQAVWTGREMLVWGGLTIPDPTATTRSGNAVNVAGRPATGVAYDPARRAWRLLPAAPPELRGGDRWTAWTGRELLVGEVEEAGAGAGTVAAAYDPRANRWRLLPESPGLSGGAGHLLARTAMWAGTRLLVWTHWSGTARPAADLSGALSRPDDAPDGIDLWAYDPVAGRWSVLPAPPAVVREAVAGASMVWTGRDVLMAATRVVKIAGKDRSTTVAGRYDPERASWTPIAPLRLRSGYRLDLARVGAVVVEPSQGTVYDPAADRWLRLPAGPDRAGVPPPHTGDLERGLLWLAGRASGEVQVHVLVPAEP
ncbi:MAG TPA: hypothetical protein VL330_14190 [Actinomycetes bacterium]|nr:hypothetical protein [Actinomycetes bacterium]